MPPRPGGLYLDRVALWRLLAGYGTARQNQGNRLALDFQVTFSTERQLLAGLRLPGPAPALERVELTAVLSRPDPILPLSFWEISRSTHERRRAAALSRSVPRRAC